jgi:hypothetical protein
MFNKKPILKYESDLEHYQEIIVPSTTVVPDWYKKIPLTKNKEFYNKQEGFVPTVKLCVPFLDAMTNGYMVKLTNDLYVKNDGGVPFIGWPGGVKNTPSLRPNTTNENIVPHGHFSTEFLWNMAVSFVVPKGYSFLFTHPLNRHDLPFTTLSGIVDGNFVMSSKGNVPFFIKDNFEGVIPQGTPIAQIIPFRQDHWKSKKESGLIKISMLNSNSSGSVFKGWYKKTFWAHKKYE